MGSFYKVDKNQANENTSKSWFKRQFKKKKNNDKTKLFSKLKEWWPLSKISGRIFLIYFFIVVLGGFLLSIPGLSLTDTGSNKAGWDFLTGVFTASSGFSDTGINVLTPAKDYTLFGQIIILILIELGGIGVLTFKIVLYIMLNRKISLTDTATAQSERGSSIRSETIELLKDGFIWLILVQVVAIVFLFFFFFFQEASTGEVWLYDNKDKEWKLTPLDTVSPYRNFGKSLWYSIFHSTSAINNAGFDVISGQSLMPYNSNNNYTYTIQIVFLLEWVIGGLGYPTFHDIKKKIKARRTGEIAHFSLFTKLNFYVYTTLFILGPLMVFLSENNNSAESLVFNNVIGFENGDPCLGLEPKPILEAKAGGQVFMDILFNTTGSRNAGFFTIPITHFNDGSQTILSILMFIGSAPSSTAGGIRTTTFAVILISLVSIIRNRKHTSIFKKEIPDETVKRAFAVFVISIIAIALAMLVIYNDSRSVMNTVESPFTKLLVLVSSAFGTVGFSPFSGDDMMSLGIASKLMLIFMMFFGQLGVSNSLLIFIKPSNSNPYKYLREDITIG